jgi:hypothetical protein
VTDSSKATRDQAAPPEIPIEDVEALITTLGKAIRAFVMYKPNNPVFQKFQKQLREAFETLWEQGSVLEMVVTENGFRYAGHTFSVGEGRDNLAFTFYKDGIRSLTMLPGFEDEVGDFLAAVNRATRRDDDADDLITVLWEEDFPSLRYGYVDLLMDGLVIPEEPRDEPGQLAGGIAVAEAESAEEGEVVPAGATGKLTAASLTAEAFDETLYFLDQREMAAVQTQVDIEMERDVRAEVLNALFDRIEERENRERQAEILNVLDQILPLLLSSGDLKEAARVLEELDRVANGPRPVLDPELTDKVEEVFERLSDPDVLEQFVQALEDGAVTPEDEDIDLFFSRLRPEALPVLMRFAAMSETEGVGDRLRSAIDGLARRFPEEIDTLLQSDEPVVVAGAVRAAGRVRLSQVLDGLEKSLQHEDRTVRLAVVDALFSIRLTPALQIMALALDDEDREVRIAAVEAFEAVRFASARDALQRHVESKRLRNADLTEKMAFFEAYGALGGTAAVERLDEILNARWFMGRRNPTELRACAALGLGKAGTPLAREALEKAEDDDDPIVKNAVSQALRRHEVPG